MRLRRCSAEFGIGRRKTGIVRSDESDLQIVVRTEKKTEETDLTVAIVCALLAPAAALSQMHTKQTVGRL